MVQVVYRTTRHSQLHDVNTPHDLTEIESGVSGESLFLGYFGGRYERQGTDKGATLCAAYGYDIANGRFYITTPAAGDTSGCYCCDASRQYWNISVDVEVSGDLPTNNWPAFGLKLYDAGGASANTAIQIVTEDSAGTDIYWMQTVDGGVSTSTTENPGNFITKTTVLVYWYDNGGTDTVKFYVGGTLKATHTTNVTTSVLRPFIANSANNPGANARTVYYSDATYSPGSAP